MAFTVPSERENQVGYLRIRRLSDRFELNNPILALFSFIFVFLDYDFQLSNCLFIWLCSQIEDT